MRRLASHLADLQEQLYAEGHAEGHPAGRRSVLLVLQGMDTAGKGGTVKHVLGLMNPMGVQYHAFKRPTVQELEHHFLWRVKRRLPPPGILGVFDRSHYEDVLVVRVHNLVPPSEWKKRYDQIVAFERMLYENGTTILKFFLHIGLDEQRKRLQARLDDPKKCWKFQHGDLEERKFWKDYMVAYQDALSKTSTAWAPWYIVPANKKWYRNHLIGTILAHRLKQLDLKYPDCDVSGVVVE